MNNKEDELLKTKALNDLPNLLAKESELTALEDSKITDDKLEDDILNNMDNILEEEKKEEIYEDLISKEDNNSEEAKPSKDKNKKENIFDKFKKLPTHIKVIIICSIITLLVLLVVLIVVLTGNKKELPKEEEKHEEVIVIDKGNYRYDNGVLKFLSDNGTEIGNYECTNKDENKCFVSYLDNNEDDLDVPNALYENEEIVKIRSNVYNNRYVFINDSDNEEESSKFLYDFISKKVMDSYLKVKSYNLSNENLVVLENVNNKYGLVEITSNEIKNVLDFNFDYMAFIKSASENNMIVKKNKSYYLIDQNNKFLTKSLSDSIYSFNDKYLVLKSSDAYKLVDYDNNVLIEDSDYIKMLNDSYVGVVQDGALYIRDYENQKYNEVGYELDNDLYNGVNIYNENGILIKNNYAFKVNFSNDNATIMIKNNETVKEDGLSLLDGIVSRELKYYSYYDGILYFYEDDIKSNLLGSYKCQNKNNLENKELNHCNVSINNNVSNNFKNNQIEDGNVIPLVGNRYIFIKDSLDDNDNDIKLYDLKDNKTAATYKKVSFNITDTKELTSITNANKIIVQNKSNKFGMINLSADGISKVYDFNYDEMELMGDFTLVKKNNKYQILYSNDTASISLDNKIVDYNEFYFVTLKDNLYEIYDVEGNKVSNKGYKYIKLLGSMLYAYVEDDKIKLNTFKNEEIKCDEIVLEKTTDVYKLAKLFTLSKKDNASVLINTFDLEGNRLKTYTVTIEQKPVEPVEENNEEKIEDTNEETEE